MGLLDILLGLPLIWGLWKGYKNGLFMEIASIVALVAGIFGAIHFSYITGNYLSEHLDWDERNMSIIAFIITLILIIIIVNLAGKILTKVANFAMLGSLNKIAGGIFGVLKVAILLGAAFIFFDRMDNTFGLIKEETKQESVLYQPIKDIGALIFDTVLKSEVLPKESTEEPVTI
ncbi:MULTISPECIES: CvpA family protein [Maribacter]|uniref:Membrane protein required for colicin V production n=1 Tax=Maribacter stanieri TaxID=440514 RepID=A0A1I6HM51_9FLAO|nr:MULTISPECIES: CvpA family protein [Maribacter]SFR55549.1 membrane protein required for colicin V production [Maribacter stanieri]|tara:strand:+ start:10818 stop:11342 length:525 start_codon:yes stop_codon:yes gene_type:complete